MYIIAKKKDYYDGVAGTTGIDKTIVYKRDLQEFEGEDMPNVFRRKTYRNYFSDREESPFYRLGNSHMKHEYWNKYPRHSYFVIGFCGKLYPGFKLYSIKDTKEYNNVITTITFDKDFMIKLFSNKNFKDNLNGVLQYNAMDWFRDIKVPIFVYDENVSGIDHIDLGWYNRDFNAKFIVNPLLKEYEFYKIFDAFQAFQEIMMFMGGVLGRGEKDIVEVEDKYKIAQHGFDKWSFRKMPENGKGTT